MSVTGVIVAALALLLVYPWHSSLPVVSNPGIARPTGSQLPLTTPFRITDPTDGPTYEIQLPNMPNVNTTTGVPGSDGTQNFGTVEIHGEQFGALLLLKMGHAAGSTPQQALESEVHHAGKYKIFDRPQASISRLEIDGTPVYALDFASSLGDDHLREFRFERAGRVYAVGIMYHSSDTVSLDTGLAALQTLHWVS